VSHFRQRTKVSHFRQQMKVQATLPPRERARCTQTGSA